MLKKILLAWLLSSLLACSAFAASHKITFDSSDVCEVDGQKMFPLSVAVLPPPDGKTPDGKSAWQEFIDGGVNFARIAPGDYWEKHVWDNAGLDVAAQYMDQFAAVNIYGWMTLGGELSYVKPDDEKTQEELEKFIKRFKDNPGLGAWKGADEPFWGNLNSHGKKPPSSIAVTYKTIHELDPDHPVIVIQAANGTAPELAKYAPYLDITGMDVFPVGYPPHVLRWPNKEISAVGDFTKIIADGAEGKPVWMTLQIADSGTAKPGKTLRFPTFFQERFMTYEAIIDGARGINYFGGANLTTLNDRDRKLGYNWTFWDRILKPLLAELNDKSPLHDALIAPDSKLPVKVQGDAGIEFLTREAGNDVYLLVCKREGSTVEVKFTGLPTSISTGDVLYEEPRKIEVKDGSFSDWFGPFDVHVYRFKHG
jgi:hypothetical protein